MAITNRLFLVKNEEDPEEQVDPVDQADVVSNYWQTINTLVSLATAPIPEENPVIQVSPLTDHLQVLVDKVSQRAIVAGNTSSAYSRKKMRVWSTAAKWNRAEDVRSVAIPAILEKLRTFSANGNLEDVADATLSLLELLGREMLRTGTLPVYCAYPNS